MITTVTRWLMGLSMTSCHSLLFDKVKQNAPVLSVIAAIFFLFASTVSAQTNAAEIAANERLQAWITEVYRDCPQYASEEYFKIYEEQVRKVSVNNVSDLSNLYNVANLTSVGLKNKCNPDLEYDYGTGFSPENFNPLKYFFDFYSTEDRFYIVDGTNYIITISK